MGILREYTSRFMGRHFWAQQVRNVLARILLCRTAPLGGRVYECPQCHEKTNMYNSCADRHCPQCAGAKRADWLDKTAKLLLPKINYFQVVFTVPDDYLNGLTLGNRRRIYKLLFQAAWQALDETLRLTGKFHSAALMVLHTWNQQLDHHPHIHALVPGGGPSLAGDHWITTKHPTETRRKQPYLVDNRVLSKCFRDKFIKGLRRLFERGKLKLEGPWSDLLDHQEANAWIEDIQSQDWNVFIEGPPDGKSDPKHVLKYLARYMTGGPIADSRLIRLEHDDITFWARPKGQRPRKGNRTSRSAEPFTLCCIEFIRRWVMHILPKGFTRTRRFGGFSGSQCEAYLQRCTKLLDIQSEPFELSAAQVTPETTDEPQARKCTRCQCDLECIANTPRPSWRVVFERLYSDDKKIYCPMWHGRCYPRHPSPRRLRPLKPEG